MTTITFDTLKVAERLRVAGVPEAQAEAEAIRDVLSEALDGQLATKADIARLEFATKTDIARLESTTKADIAEVKADLSLVKWMMGILIALAVANFAKQFF
ncbi:conserved hypothetical protein [Candidatus Accumulibacter aalborgensis]|uniref:DUF1640 domain-containing protein n=1 Tax=Candidatus Accumulibacter aalborgensis TaxID=1860102 RepID=A0A1A8XM21_9PROT|nr:hypothetical protein [Candidatus Accumulibacter aalborgensis]SBT06219.1 conserved hypothetical protein [Candidatus Accumulibacter aalborgensis]